MGWQRLLREVQRVPARGLALRPSRAALCLAGAALLGAGTLLAQRPAPATSPAASVVFTNVTAAAGITFTHDNGAFGKKYLPETMGSGVVFLDVDGDGHQDLFFVNGKSWPGQPPSPARTGSTPALYRNNRHGTFVDVTKQAGLAIELYGLGGAAADFDNDGHVDLLITALGGNKLFRNTGKGAFVDVTAKSGVGGAAAAFPASAAWVDYDRDGWLDLIVLHYVQWSIAQDKFCSLDGKNKSYCTPETYQGDSPSLYRNRRDGTFQDVTKAAGLFDPSSKALGVALLDYNEDGWLDLFLANDTAPNRLYRNNGGAKFVDEAIAAGVAFNEAGVARAGMGVDVADYDGSGRDSLVIGNFTNEMIALYHNEGGGLFLDKAPGGTIGRASMSSLTFSCFFFDFDLDGRPDIFAANGHVADDISKTQPKITHAQAPLLFRNVDGQKFDVADAGAALKERMVARGAAYGDIDLDGDPDVAINVNGGPARLFRNDGGSRASALRLTLVGSGKSNRSAIGARIVVTLVGGAKRRAMVKSGSSYLSQSELPVTFGLGTASKVTRLEIHWPSGAVEKMPAVEGNQHLTIHEGKGIVSRAPLLRK
jgi:enediyne biosynthesis protein E4